jgi:hypothetical protein
MPYLGLRDSEPVMPLDVSPDETVLCPLCEGEMGVRESHRNRGKFIARHFFHRSSADCGGESDIHKRMKTIAAVKLGQIFESATITAEQQIGDRFADVCAEFATPLKPFGKGLVVEAQHKHKEKNIGAVTHEYLEEGYSVYWAYQSDFDGHDMEFTEKRVRRVWPDAVPLTEGVEGYAEPVRNLLASEHPPVEIEVPFPPDYWRTHARELGSPVQHDQQATGWWNIDDAWLHGKGGEIAWFTLLRAPDKDYWVEFWRKDRNANESRFLPVCVGPNAAAAVETFRETAREALDDDRSYRSSDDWISIASAEFPGTRATTSWLSLAKAPRGRIKLIVGRKDTRGNTRTLAVDYRNGDVRRLDNLQELLDRIQAL